MNEQQYINALATLRVRMLREGREVDSLDTQYRALAKHEGVAFGPRRTELEARADALATAVVADDEPDDEHPYAREVARTAKALETAPAPATVDDAELYHGDEALEVPAPTKPAAKKPDAQAQTFARMNTVLGPKRGKP